jgi:hypothetical protein
MAEIEDRRSARRPRGTPTPDFAVIASAALRTCLLVSPLALLAACASDGEPPPCPQPAIVSGLQSANFRNGVVTDEPSEIAYRVTILGFSGGCDYRSEGVFMRMFVDMSGVPGPAYAGQPITFPYFVAVANPQGQVLDKQTFTASLPQPTGRRAVGVQDTIEQTIRGVSVQEGPGWRIYIGVDMPPEAALRREE